MIVIVPQIYKSNQKKKIFSLMDSASDGLLCVLEQMKGALCGLKLVLAKEDVFMYLAAWLLSGSVVSHSFTFWNSIEHFVRITSVYNNPKQFS